MTAATATLYKFAGWIVTIVTPFALILTAVRILLTPVWVQIEYRMPRFPEDPYGFTLEERLKWSLVSLEYLLNDEGIDFLQGQRFDDNAPIYDERELQHMEDVKGVVQGTLAVWWSSLAFLLVTGLLSKWGGWGSIFKTGLLRGGWATIGIVGAVLVFVVLAFGVFFVYFHQVFFDAGTWTFSFADTLIRLFPMRFWQDAFLWIGVLTILESLWLISLARS
jgi:integral membrane protein (TIGR01906 family)